MTLLLALKVIGSLFFYSHEEFFTTAGNEMIDGAEWHYVGKQPLDPTAKSFPLQCIDAKDDGTLEVCGDPYIIFKLKKREIPN